MSGLFPEITLQDEIAEAERELKMRQRVYPHQVRRGSIDQTTADRQIRIMQSIRDRLMRAWKLEKGVG